MIHIAGGTSAHTELSFDLDRLWSYNLYERSRWGAGLKLSLRDSLDISGYAAYGVRDQQWKGGVGVAYKIPLSHRGGTVYIGIARDYYAAASRRLQASNITDLAGMSAVMTQLMDDRRGITLGYRFANRRATYTFEGRAFEGYRLYRSDLRPVYLVDGSSLERVDGLELCLTMERRSGFAAQLLVAGRSNWRILMQYDRTFPLGPLDFSTFAQAGLSFPYCDSYYRFDLGGTYGSPLWFRNSMLTLRPYEHVTTRFAFASLRLKVRKPLFSLWNKTFVVGSYPRPMVGVNGVYGGTYRVYDSYDTEPGMSTYTLYSIGAVELMAGVDGLIRWGVADYGVAYCLRPYPLDDGKLRQVLLFTAALAF